MRKKDRTNKAETSDVYNTLAEWGKKSRGTSAVMTGKNQRLFSTVSPKEFTMSFGLIESELPTRKC